jgi:hypothetical protein
MCLNVLKKCKKKNLHVYENYKNEFNLNLLLLLSISTKIEKELFDKTSTNHALYDTYREIV